MDGRLADRASGFVAAVGIALLLLAVGHHVTELAAVDDPVGPAVSLLLDGLPALALVYAGYRLSGTDLSAGDRWQIGQWCLLGGVLFATIMGVSLVVRAAEGRIVSEPLLPLLIAAEAGSIAGVVAGYQTARARGEARRQQEVREALEFVNGLIRHDLRNDLTVIQGYADLLSADADIDGGGGGRNPATTIAEKSEEALSRLETAEAVAKTLAGDPAVERVNLAAIANEVTARLAETQEATVETDIPEAAPVRANAGLRSVVDNLVENALEHNDAGDPWCVSPLSARTELFG